MYENCVNVYQDGSKQWCPNDIRYSLASPPVIPSLGVLPRLVRPRFISRRLLEFYVSSVSQLPTNIKSARIEVIHTSTCINSDVPRPIAVRPCDLINRYNYEHILPGHPMSAYFIIQLLRHCFYVSVLQLM
jgi:hypothetical protein